MTKDNSTGKPKNFYSRGQQMFDSLNLPDEDDDTQVYKKPWQGLTDDEVMEMMGYDKQYGYIPQYARNFVEAITAKLKEKNT